MKRPPDVASATKIRRIGGGSSRRFNGLIIFYISPHIAIDRGASKCIRIYYETAIPASLALSVNAANIYKPSTEETVSPKNHPIPVPKRAACQV